MAVRPDCYFLDLKLALLEAERQNRCVDEAGVERLQYCYYDGPLSDSLLPNLIYVSQYQFSEFFANNTLPIPKYVVDQDGREHDLTADPGNMLEEILVLRNADNHRPNHKDTDFFNALEALNTAKQRNVRIADDGSTGLQLCYYHGEKLASDLENLIHVDLDRILEFLVFTRLRLPEELRAAPELMADYQQVLNSVLETRAQFTAELERQALDQQPDFVADRPWRILIYAANSSSILCSLAETLASAEYSVMLYVISDVMHTLNRVDALNQYVEFRPHILIQENQLDNGFLADDVINMVYWLADDMGFESLASLPFRKNDFNFCREQTVFQHLKRCGADNVVRIEPEADELTLPILWCSFNHARPNSRREILEPPIVLEGPAEEINQCAERWSGNLQALKQFRPMLYENLGIYLADRQINVFVGEAIAGEFYAVAVFAGEQRLYQLDLPKKAENIRNIRAQAKVAQRFNVPCYGLAGIGDGGELAEIFSATSTPIAEMPNLEIPIYLVDSDFGGLLATMLVRDIRDVLAENRVWLCFQASGFSEFVAELNAKQSILPEVTINVSATETEFQQIQHAVGEARDNRSDSHAKLLAIIDDYYRQMSLETWRDKFRPNPATPIRVMGFASRFTSFLQYCMRDLLDGFARAGAEIQLSTDTANFRRNGMESIVAQIAEFKPDLILSIDHFRHEFAGLPEPVPFVNWIQDMLPSITQNRRAVKSRDFTFVFSKDWLAINRNPLYASFPVEYLPLGFNDAYYYPIQNRAYQYDFLFITHLIDPAKTLSPFRSGQGSFNNYDSTELSLLKQRKLTVDILNRIYRVILEYTDQLPIDQFHRFCLDNQIGKFKLVEQLLGDHGITITIDVINQLMAGSGSRFHYHYLTEMKTRPIAALLDAGLSIELALYGRNWDKFAKFSPYAHGVAENGGNINELMNRSRICFNGSPGTSLHMRALEIMAAGCFMLSRRIYKDAAPLSEYYSDDEVAYYADEKELIEKVEFYLNNEAARSEIADKAYRKTVRLFSYRSIAERIRDSVALRLSEPV